MSNPAETSGWPVGWHSSLTKAELLRRAGVYQDILKYIPNDPAYAEDRRATERLVSRYQEAARVTAS